MKSLTHAVLITSMLSAPALAGGLTAADRAALDAASAPGLESQRAAGVTAVDFSDSARAAFAAAQQRAPELGELRAGDVTLTDHELTIIGVTVLIVLLIIIIA